MPKPKWKAPKNPRNVLIADWWDRSPCFWICNLTKLDENDSIQAEYKKAILDAVADMNSHSTADEEEEGSVGVEWLCAGSGHVPEDCDWTDGRPDEVDHAVVLPPCVIDAYVVLHYPS
jgi:hypothetical protein